MSARRPLLALALVLLALLAGLALLRPDPPATPRAEGGITPRTGGGSAQAAAPPETAGPSARPSPGDAPAPRGSFEGRVVSGATGSGAPGAEVTFSRGGAAASVRCDPDGSFRFEPPAAGRWQLAAATAPGHEPFAPEWGHSPVALEARPGERVRGLSIHLVPLVPWTGRVEDPAGNPVAGAVVRAAGDSTGDRALVPATEQARSGPAGEFTLSAPEDATLEARHPDFTPGRALLDLGARASRRVVIRLGEAGKGRAGDVVGRVVSGGTPVEGALVSARALRGGGPGSAEDLTAGQGATDADGRFTLPGLPPGRYLLLAAREGMTQAAPVVARPGEEALLELTRGGTLAGIVRDDLDGRPLVAFRIEARRAGRGPRLPLAAATVVDAEGRFRLTGLPPGPVQVLASAPGHLPSPWTEVAVPEHPGAAEVELRLPRGGRIWGNVRDRATGGALAGARVTLEGDGGSPSGILDAGAVAISAADGSFQLGGLPVRTVALHVSAEGHHARIVTAIDVPEGGAAGPVEVKLAPLAPGEEPRVELAGIGAALRPTGGGAIRITGVVPGGGAAEAGLAAGDDILAVEGQPVSELGLAGAVDRIRGPEDTRVRLTIRRGDGLPVEVWVWRRLVRG